MKQTMYCLFSSKGKPTFTSMSRSRSAVERKWLGVWNVGKLTEWKFWYRRGWRIKKVEVTIREL